MAEMLRCDPAEPDGEHIEELSGQPPTSAVVILTAVAESAPTRASIVVSRNRGTVVVTVRGELDLPRAGDLGAMLADLIDGQGNLSVVVDLHDATAKDADCLWVFTEAAERARRHGGMIRVSEPPAPLYSALQLRGLDNFAGSILDGT